MSLLIKDGIAYRDGEFSKLDILIGDNGRIAGIGAGEWRKRPDEVLDASGLVILPGLIDPHVHLREPGNTQKEDFFTGSRAAVAGGFTTVMDMPNNREPTVSKARLEEKRRLASGKAVCGIEFHFGATRENFADIRDVDPLSLKIYMGETTGPLLIDDDPTIAKHMRNLRKERQVVLHAEDQREIEKANEAGKERPEKAGIRGVERAVMLGKRTGRKIHIAHASSGKEVGIAKGKGGWGLATVETAPHYLFITEKERKALGKLSGVNPPLKDDAGRKALWKMLDKVDCIGTDHAPHLLEEKENGARGMPGLETALSLFLDAYGKKLLSLEWVAERMSANPARIFGLAGKGIISEGAAGDLTLVDLKRGWTVRGEELETKCKWSPFEGRALKGRAVEVVRGGKLVFDCDEGGVLA
ncbi:MAG: dihydroorotase [Candidatus Bilamarchaeaceae archaeon]